MNDIMSSTLHDPPRCRTMKGLAIIRWRFECLRLTQMSVQCRPCWTHHNSQEHVVAAKYGLPSVTLPQKSLLSVCLHCDANHHLDVTVAQRLKGGALTSKSSIYVLHATSPALLQHSHSLNTLWSATCAQHERSIPPKSQPGTQGDRWCSSKGITPLPRYRYDCSYMCNTHLDCSAACSVPQPSPAAAAAAVQEKRVPA